MKKLILLIYLLTYISVNSQELINGILFDAPAEKGWSYEGDLFWMNGIESIKIVYTEGDLMQGDFFEKNFCKAENESIKYVDYSEKKFNNQNIKICLQKLIATEAEFLLASTIIAKDGFTYIIRTTGTGNYDRGFYLLGHISSIILNRQRDYEALGFKKNIPSVIIGNQEWSSLNLATDTFSNGDIIPFAENKTQWMTASNSEKPVWCYYNFDSKYSYLGKLYNYYAVSDSRGLAPDGWRIPTLYDSWILANHIDPLFTIEKLFEDSESAVGGALKNITRWNKNNCNQTSTGFNAIPSGGYTPSKDYPEYDWESRREVSRFWVITDWKEIVKIPGLCDGCNPNDFSDNKAIVIRLKDSDCDLSWDDDPKIYGYSVRIIKK